MTTAGQAAGEIEKAPATAAATAGKDTPAATADKTATATQGTDKPAGNGADPADKGAGADPAASAVDKPAGSIIDDIDDDDDAEADAGAETETGKENGKVAGDFPDDWREKLAKGDDKKLARLKRYKSYEDFANAGLAAQDKIRSGDYKAKLPDEPTPEQIAEYREANGIPEKPSEYKLPEVVGAKWTPEDKAVLGGLFERLHATHAPQSVVNEALSWYKEAVESAKEKAQEAAQEKDKADRMAIEDALRAKLGGEYRPSIQLFSRLLKDPEVFPEGTAERLAAARFEDGTRVINDPAIADFFIGMARERYGDGAFISGDAKAAMSNVEEQARKIMKEDITKYYAEGWDKKLTEVLNKKAGKGRAA